MNEPALTPDQEHGRACLPDETEEQRRWRHMNSDIRRIAFAFGALVPPAKEDRFREKVPSVTWDEFNLNLARLNAKYGPKRAARDDRQPEFSDQFGSDVPDQFGDANEMAPGMTESYRKPYAD